MASLMKQHGRAKAITIDGLRSYKAAMKVLGSADKREIVRWANNRAEDSHLPFRRRERAMLLFRQIITLQTFSSVHATFHDHFTQPVASSAERPNAQPPWLDGRRSPATLGAPCPACGERRRVLVGLGAPTPYKQLNINNKLEAATGRELDSYGAQTGAIARGGGRLRAINPTNPRSPSLSSKGPVEFPCKPGN